MFINLKIGIFMKNFTFYLIIIVFCIIGIAQAAPGDRTIVRTIEFQQRRTGWYDFPSTQKQYQQILLHFKLRCPPGKPCGEWDYISYVFLNQWYAPSFRADKKVMEQLSFMTDTSWTYSQVDDGGNKVIVRSPKPSILLEFYNDKDKPTKVTDSMRVWSTYYADYKFDANGKAIDSVFVQPDSTITLAKSRVYFDDNVTFSDRWEIFRYITPYGNGITLGDGVTWTMDVTDFSPLLTGLVHLASPNGGWGDAYDQNTQEDLELTFEFIEGTPPRNVVNITKLWDYNGLTYDKNFENYISPIEYNFSQQERGAVIQVVQSGHGFGGTADNCAEFCRKLSTVKVDNIKLDSHYVWRECGSTAIYPQGGTWIYDRSNWCPGAEVQPYKYDISSQISSGGNHTIDYDMEYYDLQWSGGSNTKPNWVIAGFLTTYGDINHNLDVRINEIISPNNDRMYNRYNPICGSPVIKIQNTGREVINKVLVKYGNNPDKTATAEITLDEPLQFMEEIEITLPNNGFYDKDKPGNFNVEILKANDKTDDNLTNNTKSSSFETNLPEYFGDFTIELITPNSNVLGISSPISYYLEDSEGNIIRSRETTENSMEYKDDVHLENGCYRLTVINSQGFGLGFWAYQQSGLINGSLKFSINGAAFKLFPSDWGNFIVHEFTVGSQPELTLDITGDTLNFGDVLLGQKATQTIELSPANEKGIQIEELSVLLGSSKKFEIIKTEPALINGKLNVKYGEKLLVTLGFEPMSEGIKNAPFRISSNDFLNWQKTIVLTGRGRDPNHVSNSDNQSYSIEMKADFSGQSNMLNLNITTTNPGYSGDLYIYNILGTKVLEIRGLTLSDYVFSGSYDVSSLQSGVYLVSFDYQGTGVRVPLMIAR